MIEVAKQELNLTDEALGILKTGDKYTFKMRQARAKKSSIDESSDEDKKQRSERFKSQTDVVTLDIEAP